MNCLGKPSRNKNHKWRLYHICENCDWCLKIKRKAKKMIGTKIIEVEICDVCKKQEMADYNDRCVVCNRAICENCQSEEYECDDGAMCKKCEKKGFSFDVDAAGDYICVVLLNDEKFKGKTFW